MRGPSELQGPHLRRGVSMAREHLNAVWIELES